MFPVTGTGSPLLATNIVLLSEVCQLLGFAGGSDHAVALIERGRPGDG
jgi:hypothetical protein